MHKKSILILGAGFGGLTVFNILLRTLRKRNDVNITLIDKENFFLFSPLLHQVAVGALLPENITTPVRKLYSSKVHHFIQARVENISLADAEVMTSAGMFNYDYLVLSLGGITDTSEQIQIEGESNILLLKTVQDAVAIKNHIIEMFEKASIETDHKIIEQYLTFVISGGGYTGIELATGMSDVIYKYLVGRYSQIDPRKIRIIVLESTDRIIHDIPEKQVSYVMKHLNKHKIEVKLNSKVIRINNGYLEMDAQQIIPSQTLIHVPGIVANPEVSAIVGEKDNSGRVVVGDYLQLLNYPHVYVVGDCAHYEDPLSGEVARPRAHNAVRQARIAACNLVADLMKKKKTKYVISDTEEVIPLGRSNALLHIRWFWLSGIIAVLVWLASYSLLAISKKNRFKIALDWILSRIFGPDTSIVKQ